MNQQKRHGIISPHGNASARTAAFWRIMSAIGAGIALVGSANLLGEYLATRTPSAPASTASATRIAFASVSASPLTLALIGGGIALAAIAAACDLATSGVGARREERRLRTRILATAYASHRPNNARYGTQPAEIVSLLTDDAERVTEFRVAYLGTTIAALIVPVLALSYIAIAISPLIGLLLLAAYPLVPLLVGGFMRIFRKRSAASRRERDILAGEYLDAIRNLTPISLLGAGKRVEDALRQQGERNRRAIMRLLAGNQLVIIILDGAVGLLWITLAVLLAYLRLAAGAITISQALTVVFLIVLLIEPITQVAGFFYVGMGGIAAARSIARFLRENTASDELATRAGNDSDIANASSDPGSAGTNSAVSDAGRADTDPAGRTGADPMLSAAASTPTTPGAVSLTHVSFGYDPNQPVLTEVSLHVQPGERVAIVGPSGAGKTTLLSLLAGYVPLSALPISGQASVAGVSLAQATPATIHALSAVVAQQTWLFSGTIAHNLRLAAPHASDSELWDALERAHLAADVRRMPGGLETDVGERGALLSGGQAQRLSLARAFLSRRSLWLLDEPTAQVDRDSEQEIIAALAQVPASVTMLISTHRPALLALVDRAYEVRDGHVTPVDPRVYAQQDGQEKQGSLAVYAPDAGRQSEAASDDTPYSHAPKSQAPKSQALQREKRLGEARPSKTHQSEAQQ